MTYRLLVISALCCGGIFSLGLLVHLAFKLLKPNSPSLIEDKGLKQSTSDKPMPDVKEPKISDIKTGFTDSYWNDYDFDKLRHDKYLKTQSDVLDNEQMLKKISKLIDIVEYLSNNTFKQSSGTFYKKMHEILEDEPKYREVE